MPSAIAVGSGPVAFTTSSGKFLLIPLSAITFVDNELTLSDAYDGDYKTKLKDWLQYLAKIGSLKPGATPPLKPALKIEAADAGAAGNNIQVEFKSITPNQIDSQKTTLDVVITKQETYTISYEANATKLIEEILGTDTDDKGALVHVQDKVNSLPPLEGIYTLETVDPAKKSTVTVPSPSPGSTAFILEARKVDDVNTITTVNIGNINTTTSTFTIVAEWKQKLTGIKLPELKDINYPVEFKTPDGNSDFAIPAAGIIRLGGGADKQEAKPASAVAFTS